MKVGGSCAVSSAASTGYGQGSSTFVRLLPLGQHWKDFWVPSNDEAKGVRDDLRRYVEGHAIRCQMRALRTLKYVVAWRSTAWWRIW